ncbi:MAG: YMGG-like glycine zipper-containing protein [Akkermansiaceae bacterium]
MKNTLLIITAIASTSFFTSCGGTPGQQAAGGALLGAGLGAVIGHQSGHAAEGAAVGAAAGGLGGYATARKPQPRVYYR